jgi:hypothetical protein
LKYFESSTCGRVVPQNLHDKVPVPAVAGAVTVFVAGLAGAVDRIIELFGGNMLTITSL